VKFEKKQFAHVCFILHIATFRTFAEDVRQNICTIAHGLKIGGGYEK